MGLTWSSSSTTPTAAAAAAQDVQFEYITLRQILQQQQQQQEEEESEHQQGTNEHQHHHHSLEPQHHPHPHSHPRPRPHFRSELDLLEHMIPIWEQSTRTASVISWSTTIERSFFSPPSASVDVCFAVGSRSNFEIQKEKCQTTSETYPVKAIFMWTHRVILAARSPVFAAMFSSHFRESRDDRTQDALQLQLQLQQHHQHLPFLFASTAPSSSLISSERVPSAICITDVSAISFRLLLEAMYTDGIGLTQENVLEVLYAAEKYQVSVAIRLCRHYLSNHISPMNALPLLEVMSTYHSSHIDLVIDYIERHASSIIDDDDIWFSLSSQQIQRVVALPRLGYAEAPLFRRCVMWAEHQAKLPQHPLYRETLGHITLMLESITIHDQLMATIHMQPPSIERVKHRNLHPPASPEAGVIVDADINALAPPSPLPPTPIFIPAQAPAPAADDINIDINPDLDANVDVDADAAFSSLPASAVAPAATSAASGVSASASAAAAPTQPPSMDVLLELKQVNPSFDPTAPESVSASASPSPSSSSPPIASPSPSPPSPSPSPPPLPPPYSPPPPFHSFAHISRLRHFLSPILPHIRFASMSTRAIARYVAPTHVLYPMELHHLLIYRCIHERMDSLIRQQDGLMISQEEIERANQSVCFENTTMNEKEKSDMACKAAELAWDELSYLASPRQRHNNEWTWDNKYHSTHILCDTKQNSCTLLGGGHGYVFGDTCFKSGLHAWRVTLKCFNGWIFMGVIQEERCENIHKANNSRSYADVGSYGFSSAQQRYYAGEQKLKYTPMALVTTKSSWFQGDIIDILLDCDRGILRYYNLHNNNVLMMRHLPHNTKGVGYRPHFNLHDCNDSIHIESIDVMTYARLDQHIDVTRIHRKMERKAKRYTTTQQQQQQQQAQDEHKQHQSTSIPVTDSSPPPVPVSMEQAYDAPDEEQKYSPISAAAAEQELKQKQETTGHG